MLSLLFTLSGLAALGAAQFGEEPPTDPAPDTIATCTFWAVAAEGETCSSLSEYWGPSVEEIKEWNPSLADSCDAVVGLSYCVENYQSSPPVVTTTTTSTPTPEPTPTTALEACQQAGGGYGRYCDRCVSICENRDPAQWSMCYYSVFMTMNYYDSQCWQHGGNDCANKAADQVCPAKN